MKNIFIVAAIVCAAACQRAAVPAASATINQEIKNETGQTILVGRANIAAMKQQPYKSWFDDSYNGYTTDAGSIQQLRSLLQNKRMEVFLGSWCGDSRREVPRMVKIWQAAGMDTAKLSIVFVDNSPSRYKQSPQHEERGKNIHHVPSFIVYDGPREMGRIIESPVVSLEKDLLAILQQQPYQPNYKAIEYWNKQVAGRDAEMNDASLQALVVAIKPLSRHYGELNSYGYVLMAAGRPTESLNVFKLNTMIYPAVANVFDSLAEAYEKRGDIKNAIANYEKVLTLAPGNDRAIKKIGELRKG